MAEAARIIEDDENGSAEVSEADINEACRIAEALIFASTGPVEEAELAKRMPEGVDLEMVMQHLRGHYEGRGVNLVRVARKWTFRTATDLGWLLSRETTTQKKLSRAALETLAIIAYHQPVTRADIEEIRGVAISKGTLDVLIETGWVRLRGRRKSPGRPVTYGTTEEFLLHFGLEQITDLPGLDELKGAGLFDGRLPPGFGVPTPDDNPDLAEDEDPLDDGDLLDLAEAETEEGEAADLAADDELSASAPDANEVETQSQDRATIEATDTMQSDAAEPEEDAADASAEDTAGEGRSANASGDGEPPNQS